MVFFFNYKIPLKAIFISSSLLVVDQQVWGGIHFTTLYNM